MMMMWLFPIVLLVIMIAVTIAMCFVERFIIRKFGIWGIVIPIVSCLLAFINFLFLIGAAIQFVIFIVMFQKQKKLDEMQKMNIQDL